MTNKSGIYLTMYQMYKTPLWKVKGKFKKFKNYHFVYAKNDTESSNVE